jgi:4-amino-4-deoxy-L-arabinose transferase-like glycosyltransferase
MIEAAKPASRYYVVILLAIQLTLGLPFLGQIPRVFIDEAWDAALSHNLAENGKLSHPFIECLGGMEVHYLPNRLVMPFFSALIFKFSDCTVFTSRLGSQIFAAITVIVLYTLTKRLFGTKQAFFMVLATIINPWFFEISRRARPDVYYTALSLIFLLAIINCFERGSRFWAFIAGLLAGLLSLTHMNGILLAVPIMTGALIMLRNRRLFPLFIYGGIAFMIVVLPYLLYLIWAVQQPDINFWKQMQGVFLSINPVKRELHRWKEFFLFPKLLPIGLIMCFSWVVSWYRSKKEDKVVAIVVAGFSFLLLLGGINGTERYLAVIIPFWSILIIRLIFRLPELIQVWVGNVKLIITLQMVIVVIYGSICLIQIGRMFLVLHNADFNLVLEQVAEVTGPDEKIYADPIFWFGHNKFNYGPYLMPFEGMPLKDCIKWARGSQFKYVVRTHWEIHVSFWAEKPPMKSPDFRINMVSDHLCRWFGTKIYEFYDPYYGPIEIYSLDWKRVAPIKY